MHARRQAGRHADVQPSQVGRRVDGWRWADK